ncbi:MAG: M3 family oligoendopeptidase [Deltaproteobacteria bacterium]|nr:MAG: M3 family oligoendopeptidase [Deltaproteobacteria bacterium]
MGIDRKGSGGEKTRMTMSGTPKFAELTYERIDMAQLGAAYERLLGEIDDAGTGEALNAALDQWMALRSHFATMKGLNRVLYTLDTRNEAVRREKAYFEDHLPEVEDWNTQVCKRIVKHPQREAIAAKHGRRLLDLLAVEIETFSPRIADHLRREEHLVTEYTDLLASARIPFDGAVHNLSRLARYYTNPDRNLRHGAQQAREHFFLEHAESFDTLYDELVHLRHEMARILGYENFIPLAYRRMRRLDYGPGDVEVFRAEVVRHVVPLAAALRERQGEILGVDPLMFWDEGVGDTEPPPTPLGDTSFIVRQAAETFSEMSPETGAFFEMMTEGGFYDLDTRDGKAGGGYCTSFPDYGVPFIFCNFNGTAGDVRVLMHESGHAFQKYCSRHLSILDYQWPTSEAAEIHSMSMEFFTWPSMERFFGERDAIRYRNDHLRNRLLFLPYGCAVDEFQHFVYAHPEAGPKERKAFWRQLERKYLPWRDYGDLSFLAGGALWQSQHHIYRYPFYYIDYVLALTCALQFWKRMQNGKEGYWEDYLRICKIGGSRSFLEIVAEGRLESPFRLDVLSEIVKEAAAWLATHDDRFMNGRV